MVNSLGFTMSEAEAGNISLLSFFSLLRWQQVAHSLWEFHSLCTQCIIPSLEKRHCRKPINIISLLASIAVF